MEPGLELLSCYLMLDGRNLFCSGLLSSEESIFSMRLHCYLSTKQVQESVTSKQLIMSLHYLRVIVTG